MSTVRNPRDGTRRCTSRVEVIVQTFVLNMLLVGTLFPNVSVGNFPEVEDGKYNVDFDAQVEIRRSGERMASNNLKATPILTPFGLKIGLSTGIEMTPNVEMIHRGEKSRRGISAILI